jgi:hypothetical protein
MENKQEKTNILNSDTVYSRPQLYPRIPYDKEIYNNLTLKTIKQIALVQILGLFSLIISFVFINIPILPFIIIIVIYFASNIILTTLARDTVDDKYGFQVYIARGDWDVWVYESMLAAFFISFSLLTYFSNFFREIIDKRSFIAALGPFFMFIIISTSLFHIKEVRVSIIKEKNLIFINGGIVLFWLIVFLFFYF